MANFLIALLSIVLFLSAAVLPDSARIESSRSSLARLRLILTVERGFLISWASPPVSLLNSSSCAR
jgi:hypothetical protein